MLLKSNSKVLIVAAHPDDETLGCGGTIYKLIKSGADVSILILGEGVSSRFDEKDYHNENYVKATKIRNQGFLNALKVLGVKNYADLNKHLSIQWYFNYSLNFCIL